MLKRAIAVLVALVVGTAVIYGGVTLYKVRHELFRHAGRVGGTEVSSTSRKSRARPRWSRPAACCEALRRQRLRGRRGAPRRDEAAGGRRAQQPAARRPGRGRCGGWRASAAGWKMRLLANADADKDGLEEAEKAFLAMKGPPIKPGERRARR